MLDADEEHKHPSEGCEVVVEQQVVLCDCRDGFATVESKRRKKESMEEGKKKRQLDKKGCIEKEEISQEQG